MSSIIPIPTTRVSDSLVRQRLLSQLANDQLALVQLQTQLSTGRKIIAPSDDPQASLRAIDLQRLLQRKQQVQKNLANNQSYLSTSDTAISSVVDLLRTVRGDALAVVGVTGSDQQRQAVVQQINAAIKQLVNIGNTQFQGRYLFAGSRASQPPFSQVDNVVSYTGNELKLNSYSDIDQLFASNVDGQQVFGSLSTATHGPLPAIPSAKSYTLLSDVREGLGIDLGSIAISDGTTTATVDLSSARTLGDVKRLLEANPPGSRVLTVGVTNDGLTLQLDGGSLSVNEVGGGSTAEQLGILQTTGIGTQQLVGESLTPRQVTDLNPNVTAATRLVDLNGGAGVALGSIVVSDGTNSSVVDLSGAETVGDVARKIAANPPAGQTATVHITSRGLTVSLSSGNLSINEVAQGSTAADLGILFPVGTGPGPLVGSDINPRITNTTPLTDIAGSRATAFISPAGTRNDLIVTATQRGNAGNGVAVTFVDDGTVIAGSEVVTYNAAAGTLVVKIQSGVTNASQVVSAINAQAGSSFTAELDESELGNNGAGTILSTASDPTAAGTTADGKGVELDVTSGLKIVNGGRTHTIPFSTLASDATVSDLLNLLNASDAGVLAQISEDGTGIDLRSRLSGSDFEVGENGGDSATHLGVRSFSNQTELARLNYGAGVHQVDGADFLIQRKDGTQLSIDIDGAETIGDIVELINNDPGNQNPAHRVLAQLTADGNGISLSTSDVSTTAAFQVVRANGAFAAVDLGLVPAGADTSIAATSSGGTETINGRDTNPQEVAGVFTALTRLRDALTANNDQAIERAVGLLDTSIDDVNFTRASLGAQQQSLDLIRTRLEDEEIELKSAFSDQVDADLPTVISEYAAKQAAFQATLQITAQIARQTLLDYL